MKHTNDIKEGIDDDGAVHISGFTLIHGYVFDIHVSQCHQPARYTAPRLFIHFYGEGGGGSEEQVNNVSFSHKNI